MRTVSRPDPALGCDPRAQRRRGLALALSVATLALAAACFRRPDTTVVLDNAYAPSATGTPIIYTASWQTASFAGPIDPGASSDAASAVPTSGTTAYVVLAPGWDAGGPKPPTSLVVMQSNGPFSVELYDTLHIPVDDTTFTGNCAAGHVLSQAQADFITANVFPDAFASIRYEAASCTTFPIGDAGAP
jgi:hypothetical protein